MNSLLAFTCSALFIIMTRNIKEKLHELRVGENTAQIMLGDIFGRQVELQRMEGFVDAESLEEFDQLSAKGGSSLIRCVRVQ